MSTRLHPRRWLRFSLRSLLVVTTVIALFTARWVNRARDQRTAIAVLKRHYPTCSTQYDYEFEHRRSVWPRTKLIGGVALRSGPRPEPNVWAPVFLQRWLGPDFFIDLASVEIPESSDPLAVEVTQALAKLASLRDLRIRCPVSDDDVLALTRHAPLNILWLSSSSQLTDKSLRAIVRLHDLEELVLCAADYGTEALGQLSRLRNLRELRLERDSFGSPPAEINFSDEQLAAIARIESLEFLSLKSNLVTDAGLAELRHLVRLKDLFISATLPIGEAFSKFRPLKDLEYISLDLPRAKSEVATTILTPLASLKTISFQEYTWEDGAFKKGDSRLLIISP